MATGAGPSRPRCTPYVQLRTRAVLNRLKTARGHLDGIVRMVEDEVYCPDLMKQLSAVQGSRERASRLVLRNHLETCVAAAMQAGRIDELVDELMEALRYAGDDRFGPSSASLGPREGQSAGRRSTKPS